MEIKRFLIDYKPQITLSGTKISSFLKIFTLFIHLVPKNLIFRQVSANLGCSLHMDIQPLLDLDHHYQMEGDTEVQGMIFQNGKYQLGPLAASKLLKFCTQTELKKKHKMSCELPIISGILFPFWKGQSTQINTEKNAQSALVLKHQQSKG